MCYFLYIASSLTLSEVRSMLPAGMTADLVAGPLRAALQKLHPPTKTVARLLVGGCSCDLVRPRLRDVLEDERELRTRYRKASLSRIQVIQELERHRRGASSGSLPPAGWAEMLSGFVMEHARNAGTTLYLLDFAPASAGPQPADWSGPITRSVRDVVGGLRGWLQEAAPTLVS